MGSPTTPMISAPITLTSSGTVTIVYTTAGATPSTIAAGEYYILGSGASPCLLYAIEQSIEGQDPDGTGLWSITLNSNRKITVSRASATDTALSITIVLGGSYGGTTDFGFASATTSLTAQAVTATYRPRHIWCGEELDLYDLPEYVHFITSGSPTPLGREVIDNLGTLTRYSHLMPAVPGALVLENLTAEADHAARVSGLTQADPHAALESFMIYAISLCDGLTPVMKWTPDVSNLGSNVRDVYLPGPLYAGVEAWGSRTDSPTQYEIQIQTIVEPT